MISKRLTVPWPNVDSKQIETWIREVGSSSSFIDLNLDTCSSDELAAAIKGSMYAAAHLSITHRRTSDVKRHDFFAPWFRAADKFMLDVVDRNHAVAGCIDALVTFLVIETLVTKLDRMDRVLIGLNAASLGSVNMHGVQPWSRGEMLSLLREEFEECWDEFRHNGHDAKLADELLDLVNVAIKYLGVCGMSGDLTDHSYRQTQVAMITSALFEVASTSAAPQTKTRNGLPQKPHSIVCQQCQTEWQTYQLPKPDWRCGRCGFCETTQLSV